MEVEWALQEKMHVIINTQPQKKSKHVDMQIVQCGWNLEGVGNEE